MMCVGQAASDPPAIQQGHSSHLLSDAIIATRFDPLHGEDCVQ